MPGRARDDDVQDDEMPDQVRHDRGIAGQARNDEGEIVRRFSIDLEDNP